MKEDCRNEWKSSYQEGRRKILFGRDAHWKVSRYKLWTLMTKRVQDILIELVEEESGKLDLDK